MTQTRHDRAHLAVVTTQSASNAAMLAWTCCLLLVSDSALLWLLGWSPPTVQRPDALVASPSPQGCHQCRPTSERQGMLAPWADHGPSGTNVLAMLSKESNNPR